MAEMNSNQLGTGNFYLPAIYQKNQKQVEEKLSEGMIDYAELTQWTFPDEFLCFVLESHLLKFIDKTYPNPRVKNEVPIWFLVSCQFVMRLYQTGCYHHLNYLLNAGSILTRFGFNVGAKKIGFNDKNKKERQTAIHADTVRKFFKDTDRDEIRRWYREELQEWFRRQQAFNHRGLFVLDQSRLVVPNNNNYEEAVMMPVDEHGQWYSNLGELSNEQRSALKYHRCYALSTLLNVGLEKESFHIAGYELGPGDEDELVQAERLVPSFCRQFRNLMKLLIVDRGYIDSHFIGKIRKDHDVDVLIPLRKNMNDYQEAIAIACMKNNWQKVEEKKDTNGHIQFKKEIALIKGLELWSGLDYKINGLATRYSTWNIEHKKYDENYGVLVSTKEYADPKMMITYYDLRMQTEERFRQFKHSWYITEFPSPHASLIESHVCFTLLTYSLLQLYLRRKDLQEQTRKMISSLRKEERMGKDAVLVYARDNYGVFDLDDYTFRVADLREVPRERIKATMKAQKETRLKRNQS